MKQSAHIVAAVFIATFFLVPSTSGFPKTSAYFTDFYVGDGTATYSPSFQELKKTILYDSLAYWTSQFINEKTAFSCAVVDYRNLSLEQATKLFAPDAVFIRGFVSRAEIRKISGAFLNRYVFTVTVSLEFFNLVTGTVFYTHTLSGEGSIIKPITETMSQPEEQGALMKCLRGTIAEIATQADAKYNPAVLVSRILQPPAADSIVLISKGLDDGVTQGQVFYLFSNDSLKPSTGMIRVTAAERKFSEAKVLVSDGAIGKGALVKSFNVNASSRQNTGNRYMVVEFSAPDTEAIDSAFVADPPSMGQWLHEGLSQKTKLSMVAPLLVSMSDHGSVQVQDAIFKAQTGYAIYGNISQSAVLGKRILPDVLIRGIVTYADVRTYISPGAEKKVLEMGISIEMYDRTTRNFIYSCQHSGTTVEKIVKGDRELNLSASFRDLCKRVVSEACTKIATNYTPSPIAGEAINAQKDSTFDVAFGKKCFSPGELLNVWHKGDAVSGLSNEALGNRYRLYGIAKLLTEKSNGVFTARLMVSDGKTPIGNGDLLRIESKNTNAIAGRICQVVPCIARGKTITSLYKYSTAKFTEWLHNELLMTGKYNLLAPQYREAGVNAAEVGMTLGDFADASQSKILYQGSMTPEITINGRLALADIQQQVNGMKKNFNLSGGFEIIFKNIAGDTLYKDKYGGTIQLKEIQGDEGTLYGTTDKTPDLDNLIQKLIKDMVVKAAKTFIP